MTPRRQFVAWVAVICGSWAIVGYVALWAIGGAM